MWRFALETLAAFPDAETVMMTLLAPLVAVGRTGTSTPPDLESGAFVRVQRVGGTDDGVTDRPRVEVACFASTRAAAQALQAECRRVILAAGATAVAGVLIDRAVTDTGPVTPPRWENLDVRWVPAFYRLEWRRPRIN